MKKRLALFILLVLVLSSCSFKDKYVLGIIDELPPYIYKNGKNYAGLDIEILDAVAKEEGISYTIKKVEPNEVKDELVKGNIDGLLFAYNQDENIKLTNPFIDLSMSVASIGDNNDISDIENKKVGILKTSPIRSYVDSIRGQYGFALLTFDNVNELVSSLEQKGIEYIVDDEKILRYIKKINDKIKIGYTEKINYSLSIGINKNKDKFLDIFNRGLIDIVNKGKYKEIMQMFK